MPFMKESKPDASHSRTYLTKRNYTGPQLLQTIRGQPQSPLPTSTICPTARKMRMETVREIDVMALPVSSDDESPKSVKRKADEQEEEDARPRKRIREEIKPMRALRTLRTETAAHQQEEPPSSSVNIPDFLSLSQSSQSRKRKTQYGKTNNYSSQAQDQPVFADPGDVPSTPRKSRRKSFKSPEALPVGGKRTPKRNLKEMKVPVLSSPGKKRKAFQMPEDPGLPESSSISTDTSNIFDVDDNVQFQPRGRAVSTSSLSSLDSIASYELSQQQKDRLNDSVTANHVTARNCILCPLCQCPVNTSIHPPGFDPSDLSLRKQQIFCHTHRIEDAHAEWRRQNLPSIDWDTLDHEQIPKHMHHLRQVLYRKIPSHYLNHLESALRNAKGNQTKIRRYLAHEIVEIVRPGYYGPKGAKIMGNRITIDLSNHLKRSLKADKTVRAVGVSGFVSTVLLPELLECIVVEDLQLDSGDGDGDGVDNDNDQRERARKVIADSTDIGMLLWPDDDHVVQQDEIT